MEEKCVIQCITVPFYSGQSHAQPLLLVFFPEFFSRSINQFVSLARQTSGSRRLLEGAQQPAGHWSSC